MDTANFKTRAPFILIGILIFALLLAACSSDGNETPTDEVPPETLPTQAPDQPTLPPPEPTAPPPEPTQPPPAPTPIAGDPAQALGPPDGKDTFDNDNNWTLFDNKCFKSEITGGWYVMTAKGQTVACWERTWPQVENVYIEVLVENPESCAPNDRFGLTFRMPDNNQAYMYGLFCDGRYTMTSWDGNATNIIIDPAKSDAIIVGPKEDNRIGILAQGDKFSLYANGVFLTEVNDSQFNEAGFLGFFVRASEEENGFVVKFDNLAVWILD